MAAKATAFLELNKSGFVAGIKESRSMLDGLGAHTVAIGNLISTGITASMRGARDMFVGAVKDSIDLNSKLQVATGTFEVFTKSAGKARDIVASLRQEADRTPFDTSEMIDAGKALISSAKGSNAELMKLIKTAEVLAALQPEQGLKGAAFSIKEALGGDYQSLIERFNMSRSAVNKLKDQGLSGLKLVNKAIKDMGAGPALIDKLANTFEGRKSTVISFADELKRIAGEPIFDKLSTSFKDLIGYMDGGGKAKFEGIARGIGKDLGTVVDDFVNKVKDVDWQKAWAGAKAATNELIETFKTAKQIASDVPGTMGVAKDTAGGVWDWLVNKAAIGTTYLDDMLNDDGTAAGNANRLKNNIARHGLRQQNPMPSSEQLLSRHFPGRGAGTDGSGAITAAEVSANHNRALQANQQSAEAAVRAATASMSDPATMAAWDRYNHASKVQENLNIVLSQISPTHQIMAQ